jgi:2-keto-4-pentenoate hydratase/2-oxohepta-3-ene-1,7-dioic acid hydratase in catechol pathway
MVTGTVGIGTALVDGEELPVLVRDGSLHLLELPRGTTVAAAIVVGSMPLSGVATDPLPDARLVAPLRPGKIVAIGLNYLDHVRETGMERPKQPLVFAKFATERDRA